MFYLNLRQRNKPESTSPHRSHMPDDSIPAEPTPAKVAIATKATRLNRVQTAAETIEPPGTFRTGTLHRTTSA